MVAVECAESKLPVDHRAVTNHFVVKPMFHADHPEIHLRTPVEQESEYRSYLATTEELIALAAYWHTEAEAVEADAVFFGEAISNSQWRRHCHAYERRNNICQTLLDKESITKAITRGEELLRRRWGLSPAEWQVFVTDLTTNARHSSKECRQR